MEPEATYANTRVTFPKDSDVTYAELNFPQKVKKTKTAQEAPVRTTVTTPGKTPAATSVHTRTLRALALLLCILLVIVIILVALSVRWFNQLQRKTVEVTQSAARASLLMERLTQVSEQREYTYQNLTLLRSEYGEMSRQFGDLSESLQQTNQSFQGLLKQQRQAADQLEEMWQMLQGRNQFEFFKEESGADKARPRGQQCKVKPKKTSSATFLCSSFNPGSQVLLTWSCQQGWTLQYRHCYFFAQDISSWDHSKRKCEALQARLVIINSVEEHEFVNSRLDGVQTNYWIGYSKSDDRWRWVDGSLASVQFWKDRQPDNFQNRELCATTEKIPSNRNTWNDDNCERYCKYICEKDADHMRFNISEASY